MSEVAILHGVFIWNEKGVYTSDNVIKSYKRRNAAEKYADKLNETSPNHVVRSFIGTIESKPTKAAKKEVIRTSLPLTRKEHDTVLRENQKLLQECFKEASKEVWGIGGVILRDVPIG